MFEFKQNINSIERTSTAAFPLILVLRSHPVVVCELVDVIQWSGKAMELTAGGTHLGSRTVDRA